MGTKRRSYSDKFKAKVALEAIKEMKTISELSSEYRVHPTQISTWKRLLLRNMRSCPFCGTKQLRKCPECSNSTYISGEFCVNCGHEQNNFKD